MTGDDIDTSWKPPEKKKHRFKSKATRETFPDLRDAKSKDPQFIKALWVASRAHDTAERKRDEGTVEEESSKKKSGKIIIFTMIISTSFSMKIMGIVTGQSPPGLQYQNRSLLTSESIQGFMT